MAEMITSENKTGKRSTRVDLTPMVDLGFLLITFFIFTTTMSRPAGLHIILPKTVPNDKRNETPASGALTILLGADKRIYYYEGADPMQMHSGELNSIRAIIMDKKSRTTPDKFMVIIKPGKNSSFQSLVRVLDEMMISQVKRYAMVDPEPVETGFKE